MSVSAAIHPSHTSGPVPASPETTLTTLILKKLDADPPNLLSPTVTVINNYSKKQHISSLNPFSLALLTPAKSSQIKTSQPSHSLQGSHGAQYWCPYFYHIYHLPHENTSTFTVMRMTPTSTAKALAPLARTTAIISLTNAFINFEWFSCQHHHVNATSPSTTSQLHWLPLKLWTEFQTLLLTFKAMHNLSPVDLCFLLLVAPPLDLFGIRETSPHCFLQIQTHQLTLLVPAVTPLTILSSLHLLYL